MKRTCISLLLMLCCITGIRAQIIGGQIDYRCLGNQRYEVFVTLEAPCGFQPSLPSIRALIGPDTLTADSTVLLSSTDITGLSALCGTLDSCRVDTHITKIKQHRYRGVIDLDTANACDLHFFVRESTTNYATTLSGRNFFFIRTYVNRCLAPCDQTPEEQDTYRPHLGQNQDAFLDLSVRNPVFPTDSFVYSFDSVSEFFNQTAAYTGNFGALRWITFFGFPNQNLQWPAGIHLGAQTGELFFRPTQTNQKAVLLLKIRIFRKLNGVMTEVGVKYVEKTYHLVPFSQNNLPKVLPPYSKQMCAGEKGCISIATDDDDAGDSVKVFFRHQDIPSLQISQTGFGLHPTYQVCYTPDSSQVSNIPLMFYAVAEDNHCTMNGRVIRSFSFFVREKPRATIQKSTGACGAVSLSYTLLKQLPGGVINRWRLRDSTFALVYESTEQLVDFHLPGGRYFIELRLKSSTPCETVYSDTITVAPSDYPFFATTQTAFTGCIGDSVAVGSLSQDPNLIYNWSNGGTTALHPMRMRPDTNLLVLESRYNTCIRKDSFHFYSDSTPNLAFTHEWLDTSTLRCQILQPRQIVYEWNFGDSIYKTGYDVKAQGLAFQPIKVIVTARNGYCLVQDSAVIQPMINGLTLSDASLRLYPNPFKESIQIEMDGVRGIRLFNGLGQAIPIRTETRDRIHAIAPALDIPPGFYWLMVETEKGTRVEKLVRE